MATGWLTVDLGNSRAKLRSWSAPSAARPARRLEWTPGAAAAPLEALLAELADDARVGLCSVGDATVERALTAVLEARLGAGAVRRVGPGVENTCDAPHTTGADRLFAARGAIELVQVSSSARGALVVDAGTALTVDAVELGRGPSERPRFLGGAIAPGPALLARSLTAGTARLPELVPGEDFDAGAPALGRDTPRAIAAGVVTGFRGAARELVARIREESGLEHAPVVLTGGARRYLLTPEPSFAGVHFEEPELVHRGLLSALVDAVAGVEEERLP